MRRSFPQAEIEAATGAAAVRWKAVRGGGYGTNTAKWSVELRDGRRVFVKLALDDVAVGWLRAESRIYESVCADFMPAFVAWHDDLSTLLVIEDLSEAHWPPPWSSSHAGLVLDALDRVHGTAPPEGTPLLDGMREALDGWKTVATDPEPLLATGVCSREWLAKALPVLAQASATCPLVGDAFVHLDVRSDNLCIKAERVVFVDWNHAAVGNGLIDAVVWAPSLRLEGGPEPWELVPDSRGLAALIAGFFAARAGLPPPETAPTVRDFQKRQLEVALPWAAREVGLTLH